MRRAGRGPDRPCRPIDRGLRRGRSRRAPQTEVGRRFRDALGLGQPARRRRWPTTCVLVVAGRVLRLDVLRRAGRVHEAGARLPHPVRRRGHADRRARLWPGSRWSARSSASCWAPSGGRPTGGGRRRAAAVVVVAPTWRLTGMLHVDGLADSGRRTARRRWTAARRLDGDGRSLDRARSGSHRGRRAGAAGRRAEHRSPPRRCCWPAVVRLADDHGGHRPHPCPTPAPAAWPTPSSAARPWPTDPAVAAVAVTARRPRPVAGGGGALAHRWLAAVAVVVGPRSPPRWWPRWPTAASGGFTGDVLGAAGVVAETVGPARAGRPVLEMVTGCRDGEAARGPVPRRSARRSVCSIDAPLRRAARRAPPGGRLRLGHAGRRGPRLRRDPSRRHRAHRHRRSAWAWRLAAGALLGRGPRHRRPPPRWPSPGAGWPSRPSRSRDLLEAGDLDEARRWPPCAGRARLLAISTRPSSPGPWSSRWPRTRSTPWSRRPAGPPWLGAPGALGYRAVNTLDAMVGHRSARYAEFGWASARLDDAANWLPARLTAVLVAAVRPRVGLRRWSAPSATTRPGHPSPNSGVAEAAFAAALGLRLGGREPLRPTRRGPPGLGEGRAPAIDRHRPRRATERRRDAGSGRGAGGRRLDPVLAPRDPSADRPGVGCEVGMRSASVSGRAGPAVPTPGAHGGDAGRRGRRPRASTSRRPARPVDEPQPVRSRLGRRSWPAPRRPRAATPTRARPPPRWPRPGRRPGPPAAHQRRVRGHRPGGRRAVGRGRVDEPEFALYRRHLGRGLARPAPVPVESPQPDRAARRRRRAGRRCGTRRSTRSPPGAGPAATPTGARGWWARSPSCWPVPGCAWATCSARTHRVRGPAAGPPARVVGQRPGTAARCPSCLATVDLAAWASSDRRTARGRARAAAGRDTAWTARALRRQLGAGRRARPAPGPGPPAVCWSATARASGSPAWPGSPCPTLTDLDRLDVRARTQPRHPDPPPGRPRPAPTLAPFRIRSTIEGRRVILQPLLDAVLVDIGGTLVHEALRRTPVADLRGRAARPASSTTWPRSPRRCGSAR